MLPDKIMFSPKSIMHPSCHSVYVTTSSSAAQYSIHKFLLHMTIRDETFGRSFNQKFEKERTKIKNLLSVIIRGKNKIIKVAASNESSSSIPSPSQSISLITIESSSAILAVGDTVVLPTQGGSNLQSVHRQQQQIADNIVAPVSRDISSTGGVMTGY